VLRRRGADGASLDADGSIGLPAIAVALSFPVLVACTSGASTPNCIPGRSIACVGAGGCVGGQSCKTDGSGYDVCVCGLHPVSTLPDDAGHTDAISLAPDANSVGMDTGWPGTSIAGDATCGDPWLTDVYANDAAGLPPNGCNNAAPSVCTSIPRVSFSCPVVRGPADSSTIAPGDTITVSVLMTNTVDLVDPCFGIGVHPGVQNILFDFPTIHLLKPTRDFPLSFTVALTSSLTPGTVLHFVVSVPLFPCPGDTGAIEFDVTVG
jgi:hypothetical protein